MRAVSYAVQALRRDHPEEDMVLLAGDLETARSLRLWLDGEPVTPDGYALERSGGKPSSLEWLIDELGKFPESYRVEDVAGGDVLDGAAWQLAGLTTQAARKLLERDQLRDEAAAVVEAAVGVTA